VKLPFLSATAPIEEFINEIFASGSGMPSKDVILPLITFVCAEIIDVKNNNKTNKRFIFSPLIIKLFKMKKPFLENGSS